MRLIKIISLIMILALFVKCGDPDVDLTNAVYNPKITVEAYLFCGETVKDIRLTRNFELGKYQKMNQIYLTPSANKVVVNINGTPLNFNPSTKTYYNNQITIDYGKEYKITVTAEIDGKQLSTSSTTTTPQKGFSVYNRNLGTVKYRQSPLKIDFKTSPGTDLYIFSFMADSASLAKFIYNNPYFPNLDSTEVGDRYNDYKFQYNIMMNIDSYSGLDHSYIIQGYDTWFYGPYTATIYAGDKNFRYYLFSATNVKEMDGNFHEPVQIFEGDGIGVFASAIRETVKFTITK